MSFMHLSIGGSQLEGLKMTKKYLNKIIIIINIKIIKLKSKLKCQKTCKTMM